MKLGIAMAESERSPEYSNPPSFHNKIQQTVERLKRKMPLSSSEPPLDKEAQRLINLVCKTSS
jgi:hypothetical protein